MIPPEKQTLREQARSLLRQLSAGDRTARSSRIAGHLRGLPGIPFGFAPLGSEPLWFADWPADRLIALPRVVGAGMEFFTVRVAEARTLPRGPLGAPEPPDEPDRRIDLPEAETILVPGLAFDAAGRRLGRGGGYYDRLLADPRMRARRVGVCFGCQIVPRVPTEAHDQSLDALVSEAGWLDAPGSGSGRD